MRFKIVCNLKFIISGFASSLQLEEELLSYTARLEHKREWGHHKANSLYTWDSTIYEIFYIVNTNLSFALHK